MKRGMRLRVQHGVGCVAALVIGAGVASARGGGVTRVIVDDGLKRLAAKDVVVDEASVRFVDADERPRTLERARVLAILPGEGGVVTKGDGQIVWRELTDVRRDATGRVEMVDGQVFPGRLSMTSAEAKSGRLRWFSATVGELEFAMDDVSVAVLQGEKALLPKMDRSAGDVVGLVNQDRVEGFVAKIGSEVEVEVSSKPVTLGLERVAFVRFANAEKAAKGARAWLSDATVMNVGEVRMTAEGAVQMRVPARGEANANFSIGAEDVVAVGFDTARVRGLAAMPMRVVGTPKDRLWAKPPTVRDPIASPLGAGEVEMPGPMTVEWTLPTGAERVAGVAELPAGARAWGDFTLVLEVMAGATKKEVLRERMYEGKTSVEFNFAVGAPDAATAKEGVKLRATIDPGESGPIQDRVALRRVLVLVK